MKKVLIILVAVALAVLAAVAAAEWNYEGQWGGFGIGNGQFNRPQGLAVAANGNVYVGDNLNHRIQCFTPTGTFLFKWGGFGTGPGSFNYPAGVKVGPKGNFYVADRYNNRIQYFNPAGSFLGSWSNGLNSPVGLEIAPNGTVYVVDQANYRCQYFTSAGSWLGSWPLATGGRTTGVGRAANGNLYFANYDQNYVYYCNPTTGSLLGSWGSFGSGPGQFYRPASVRVAPDGYIYVGDSDNHRIQYFTANGSFVGSWGEYGTGDGQFNRPCVCVFVSSGAQCYVSDRYNHRIQYFKWGEPAVTPASLGRVKALFR